ncbi:MAG TPA: YCF48-related protein [Opitutaceae bacterium]|nr:YCF48-related protein [Opitutaceae bacterium]
MTSRVGCRPLWSIIVAIVVFGSLTVRAIDSAANCLLLGAAVTDAGVVAVGERGTVLRSSDAGVTWRNVTAPTGATLTAVSFGDSRHGWAVGHDAIVLATTDGGRSWSKQWQGENLSDSFLDVLALDARHVIAVGGYGLYLSTADGGMTWSRRKIRPDDYHFNRITRGPTGTLYLAGEHGTLLRSTDRGESWTQIPAPYDGSFYGILPLGPRVVLAYGLRGRVYRSADDGASWTSVVTSENELIAAGVLLPPGVVILGGQVRALLVSTNDGATFARAEAGPSSGIAEIVALPDHTLITLGEAGATRITAREFARATKGPGAGSSTH